MSSPKGKMNRPPTPGEALRKQYPTLTSAAALKAFEYDPISGALTHRLTCSSARSGSEAGTRTADGYMAVSYNGRKYLVHRVIWLMQTGSWPTEFVDHANRDGLDNRWANLRSASKSENNRNSRPRGNGLKGTSLDKRCGKFRASIRNNGKWISLGYFATEQEAHEAYMRAAKIVSPIFARAA